MTVSTTTTPETKTGKRQTKRSVELPNIIAELAEPRFTMDAKQRRIRAQQVCILLSDKYKLWGELREFDARRDARALAKLWR